MLLAMGLLAPSADAAIHYQLLKSFGWPDRSEHTPYGSLTEGSEGMLYGTAYDGGLGGAGAAFKLNKDGSGYQVLHHFGIFAGDGRNSYSGLIEGPGGALYGVTWAGGTNGAGTIFRVNKDGSGYTFLHHFAAGPDGANPPGALILASDSYLYGTTQNGGTNSGGTVFSKTALVLPCCTRSAPSGMGGIQQMPSSRPATGLFMA